MACTATLHPPLPTHLLASRSGTTATPPPHGTRMSGISSSRAIIRSCSGSVACFLERDCYSISVATSEADTLLFGKYLTYPEKLTWLVNEIPAVVALGRTIAREEAAAHLRFTTDYARLSEADILLASGVLQVLEDWNGFLKRTASLPRHILINRTPVSDQPHMVTLCAIGVSFNPYHIFNRRSFVAAFVDLGYRLVDEWLTSDLGCRISDHPSHSLDAFGGFYFVLDRATPSRTRSIRDFNDGRHRYCCRPQC